MMRRIAGIVTFLLLLSGIQAQTLELGNDTSVCNNYPFVIDAGPGFYDYTWSTGSHAQSIVATGTGEYSVTVTDTLNNVFVDSIHVTIHSSPIAVFLANNVCLGLSTPFINLSHTIDSIASWAWDFGDGTTDTNRVPTHIYASPGIKHARLQLTTIYGCFDSVTNPLEVFGLPAVDAGLNDSINIGDSVQLQGVTQVGTFSWEPKDYLLDTSVLKPIALPTFTTEYTLSVTDSQGCSNHDSVFIYVNLAPIAVDDIVNINAGNIVVVSPQSNDNDPNGDVLTTSIIIAPHYGTAVLLNNDSIRYTPNAHFTGQDTIVYQVCDAAKKPLCATANIFITVANVMPALHNDSIVTTINNSGTVNVLANDTDILGQQLTLNTISTPANGTLTDLGSGTIKYTPADGFSGADTFYYVACNNGLPSLCDTAYVFISVVKEALKVSNSFSPNGDGKLDYFIVEGISAFPDNHLTVFSRWGDKVYEKTSYNNEWDGKTGYNEIIPDGIYFYTLNLGDGSKALSGWVMIKR